MQRIPRRQWLSGTLGGFFGFTAAHPLGRLLADETATGRAKRVVVLWMNGGPSQFETFDPKPNTPTGGEVKAIQTAVPGLSISEYLPEMASRMDHLSVVRNLTSREGAHERAQYFMHTGYPFVATFPRPSLGSIVSHEAPRSDIPGYVSLGTPGFGPAYLGPDHAPFSVEDLQEALELLRRIRRRAPRIQFLQELSNEFATNHPTESLQRRRGMMQRIERLVDTPFVRALDLEQEPATRREQYGNNDFGQFCLLARRLLESGVRFVEIRHNGWDTHQNNNNAVRDRCRDIDRSWATLMDELAASGLLDETIVLWMGDFGRTPRINAQAGRDHFPTITPVVVGGAGLASGVCVGSTSSGGTQIVGDSVTTADLFATLLHQTGVDPAKEFRTRFGSPAAATDSGQIISELTGRSPARPDTI